MKTYTEKDLVDFGNYLLSEERKEHFEANPNKNLPTLEDRLSQVHHADLENFKDSRNE